MRHMARMAASNPMVWRDGPGCMAQKDSFGIPQNNLKIG
jgi:hypothetical protein